MNRQSIFVRILAVGVITVWTVAVWFGVARLKPVSSSDKILGDWSWFQNVTTTFHPDGTMVESPAGSGPSGTWRLMDSSARQYRLYWQQGYIEDLVLSRDGLLLNGRFNNEGDVYHIVGARDAWVQGAVRSIQNRAIREGARVVGQPYNSGGGIPPHWWPGGNYAGVVQDFKGGSKGNLTVFATPDAAYEVVNLHHVLDRYDSTGGIGFYGPPTADEKSEGDEGWQTFASGRSIGWDRRGVWTSLEGQPELAGDQSSSPSLELQVGHRTWVKSASFSCDGSLIASADGDGELRLWDPSYGRELKTVKGLGSSVAFSPVDPHLLATDVGGSIALWEAQTGRARQFLVGAGAPYAFSADGRRIAATVNGTANGAALGLWDVASGHKLWSGPAKDSPISCMVIAPDSRWAACGHKDGSIQRLDLQTGKPIPLALPDFGASGPVPITAAAISPDGRSLAIGRDDATISVLDLPSWTIRQRMHGDYWGIDGLQFLPDGRSLISGGADLTGRLWDADSGKLIRMLYHRPGYVFGCAYCPQHDLVAFPTASNLVYLVQARTGQVVRALGRIQGSWSLDISPDGSSAVVGNSDGSVRTWDLSTGALIHVLDGFSGLVRGVTISPDGTRIAAVSIDGTVKVWDRVSGMLLRSTPRTVTVLNEDREIQPIAISPDGRLLVCPADWGKLRCWDMQTGKLPAPFLSDNVRVDGLCFSPDGARLAAVGIHGDILIWDVRTRSITRSIHQGMVIRSVAFSADGLRLIAGYFDGTIRIWDAATGQLIGMLPSCPAITTCLKLSPDGKTLAASGQGGVSLIDMETGIQKSFLKGPPGFVESVRFTPDGARIVGGSTDGGVWVWSTTSGKLLATMLGLPEHDQWLTATPEGYFTCSANAEYLVRWRMGASLYPVERYLRRFRRPDLVQKALNMRLLDAPSMSRDDVPPSLQFVAVNTDPADHDGLSVTLEAYGHRALKSVELMVNGRPLPPSLAVPTAGAGRRIAAAPIVEHGSFDPGGDREDSATFSARPISLGAKTIRLGAKSIKLGAKSIKLGAKSISLGAKAIELGAKAISLGAKPVELGPASAAPGPDNMDRDRPNATRYTFRVPIPLGASKIELRAVAYDSAALGSNPAEVDFVRPSANPVPGDLYVLAVGLSQYLHGSSAGVPGPGQFRNLQFPAADANAIADRLKREGSPLYRKTVVHLLSNSQATLKNIRQQLKWLQQSVRPGQVDTVIVFLSGHGVSDAEGHYYFPSYNFDKHYLQETGLSAEELQDALGGRLPARNVFLFADTCHSGALAGRSDDLSFGVHSSGIYMIASTGAGQSSYESPQWGHGAFTSAMLWALGQRPLSDHGIIRYNALMSAVPRKIAEMMQDAGQSALVEQPVVPLEGRNITEPVAYVR